MTIPDTGVIPAAEVRKPLPPLPKFTCGVCGETFGTNYAGDEIECPCGARRCPHCEQWFGGDD